MSVLIVFIDGIGLGAPEAEFNPFVRSHLPAFTLLSGGPPGVHFSGRRPTAGGVALALDASLGVDGLPQSATGQTALLTGVNAPARMGRHYSAYPPPTLLKILRADNLFLQALRHGQRPLFLNSFSQQYLNLLHGQGLAQPSPREARAPQGAAPEAPGGPARRAPGRRRRRLPISASVAAALAAGLPLLDEDDLAADRALFHDVTGQWAPRWAESSGAPGVVLPRQVRTPGQAATVAVQALTHYDLVFFEHFLTDLVGHRRLDIPPEELLQMLDAFLAALVDQLPRGALLLVVSDHGNLEDMSTRVHTYNPVPLLAWGDGAAAATAGAQNLTHLAAVVGRALGWSRPAAGIP